MKKIHVFLVSVFLAFFTIILIGCGQSINKELVGTWSNTKENVTIVVNEDKTVSMSDGGSKLIKGTWSTENGELITRFPTANMKGVATSEEYVEIKAKIPEKPISKLTFDFDGYTFDVYKG